MVHDNNLGTSGLILPCTIRLSRGVVTWTLPRLNTCAYKTLQVTVNDSSSLKPRRSDSGEKMWFPVLQFHVCSYMQQDSDVTLGRVIYNSHLASSFPTGRKGVVSTLIRAYRCNYVRCGVVPSTSLVGGEIYIQCSA